MAPPNSKSFSRRSLLGAGAAVAIAPSDAASAQNRAPAPQRNKTPCR